MSNLQDVQRFDWEIEDNHYYCAPNKDGEWCKFDDAEDKLDWAMQQVERSLEKQLSSAQKESCGSPAN